jgi:predicted outer membrane protein
MNWNWKLSLMSVVGCAFLSQAAYSQEAGHPKRGDRPPREAMLLGFIHQANQNEIALSKLALQNSSSTQVKDFANRMIADHTQADDQVVAFASSHNVDLPSLAKMTAARAKHQAERTELANRSKEIGSETGEYAFYDVGTGGSGFGFDFQATMDRLRDLKGPDFDREYASAMVKDHQIVSDRLNRALTGSADVYSTRGIKDPNEIKLINQLLSTIGQHLSQAKQLQDSLKS